MTKPRRVAVSRERLAGQKVWWKAESPCGACKLLKSLKTAKEIPGKAWTKKAKICMGLTKSLEKLGRYRRFPGFPLACA